jgi:hypothetical protein
MRELDLGEPKIDRLLPFRNPAGALFHCPKCLHNRAEISYRKPAEKEYLLCVCKQCKHSFGMRTAEDEGNFPRLKKTIKEAEEITFK